jgi:protoporphyrinogen oxidase
MKRRNFIQVLLSVPAAASILQSCQSLQPVKGGIVGAGSGKGHLLRKPPVITQYASEQTVKTIIVGGGISGLSAAYHLSKTSTEDVMLLELEPDTGGNARSGQNQLSAYPWGAHYVPIPGPNLPEYIEFLKEAGVVKGFDEQGHPIFNEYYLCADPEERLYINGQWQEGLVPDYGLDPASKQQIRRFLTLMDTYRHKKGRDGKDAFAIPVDTSSLDQEFQLLDQLTMQQWMSQQGFDAKALLVYVDYCTRDDFGTGINTISAWAAIHYFAGRKGIAANAESQDVLTWPEGNGFLVNALRQKITAKTVCDAVVMSVKLINDKVEAIYLQGDSLLAHRVMADKCILATPQYVTAKLLHDEKRGAQVKQHMHYTPWAVLNAKVKKLTERSGMGLCWDNVIHGNASLGYVVADHNLVDHHKPYHNITYYIPYAEGQPADIRQQLSAFTHEQWVAKMVAELSVVHPDIRMNLEELNVMIWGHAMCQPRPGMIFNGLRKTLREPIDKKIYFAHTDLAGISIFEEGFYQGLRVAKEIQLA